MRVLRGVVGWSVLALACGGSGSTTDGADDHPRGAGGAGGSAGKSGGSALTAGSAGAPSKVGGAAGATGAGGPSAGSAGAKTTDGGSAGATSHGGAGGQLAGGAAGHVEGGSAGSAGAPTLAPEVALQIGDDVAPAVASAITDVLGKISSRPVKTHAATETIATLAPGSTVIAIGDVPSAHALISSADAGAVGSEGYVLRTGTVAGVPAIATLGQSKVDGPHGNIGHSFGAYALLEDLGFAFLEPLAATLPTDVPVTPDAVDRSTTPRWAIRGLHIHTQHPLELTEMLEGFGPGGSDDEAGWEARLPEWDSYLQWSLANGQNRVQWILLDSPDWADFSTSAARQTRLTKLVARAHDFGIDVGLDVPIALQQQNAFRLVTDSSQPAAAVLAQIDSRIDYVMAAGFDYLATESGSTEFTAPQADQMLSWMNEVATHLQSQYGKRALIKAHASKGQTAAGYTDPTTGDPLNFNFLPEYADANMGVMPHTVELYSLDDPAPTYGNTDFGYIRDFLGSQVGKRQVVWYGENAYWVGYDSNVPLFLPLYGERRLHDLRLLASDEDAGLMNGGGHMDGQITFSSGWEWGYWMQEVMTARAAWDPQTSVAEGNALSSALTAVTRAFGPKGDQIRDVLEQLIQAQQQSLVLGEIGAVAPADITRRSGMAYLEGIDSADDIASAASSAGISAPQTKPGKLGLEEMRNPLHDAPGYSAEVEPLLAEMETRFVDLADQLAAFSPDVPANAAPLYLDIVDGTRLLALRSVQVHGLYDYVDGYFDQPDDVRMARLQAARDALDGAAKIIAAHESNYRVPADRIAAWRPNPTAYAFTYLWTARSLYYWWRDEAKAVLIPKSPCYMNIFDPAKIAFGEGTYVDVAGAIASLGGVANQCLAAPTSEPVYPLDNLRSLP